MANEPTRYSQSVPYTGQKFDFGDAFNALSQAFLNKHLKEKEQLTTDIRTIAPTMIAANRAKFSPTPQKGYTPFAGTNIQFGDREGGMVAPGGFPINDIGDYNTFLGTLEKKKNLSGSMDMNDFKGLIPQFASAITAQSLDTPTAWQLKTAKKGSPNPYNGGLPFADDEEVALARQRFYSEATTGAGDQAVAVMMAAWNKMNKIQQGGQTGEIKVRRKADGVLGTIPSNEFDPNIYEEVK